jgi:hypothetical protein
MSTRTRRTCVAVATVAWDGGASTRDRWLYREDDGGRLAWYGSADQHCFTCPLGDDLAQAVVRLEQAVGCDGGQVTLRAVFDAATVAEMFHEWASAPTAEVA